MKKYIVIGALGIVFAGVSFLNIETLNSPITNNEIEQVDTFSHVKAFDFTGYVVGIHKNSNRIEVADVETKEAAIEFSEKRNDFINLASENKFLLFENTDNQEYEVGQKVKISTEKTERINHLIRSALDPVVTKLTDEKQIENGHEIIDKKL
ncbi:hypothetical protein FORC13_p114 (plasmid) [Bacillus cereus]|uniref:DUF3221 domain-containing protein n=1 Tax=Bacillus cereus TaxID=1396 RepID=UPI000744C0EF|nr:DUF3221 domain-containing protein [Bacillus cereus]ALZ64599.1 hypothetical protein FORC13_p114 [Bacillus cereus]OTX25589.1 DUF3221 domain-containing protein [Bacillus thuringiensis serovar malayensis]OUB04474.1 DUF3221 domain-containing protein [Bacillus thuringiensis serovar shandongiensis]